MALSVVQHPSISTSDIASGTAAAVLSSNTTLGNAVVLVLWADSNTANAVSSVSSSIGTFTYVASIHTVLLDQEIWFCPNVTGAADTVTVTTIGTVLWAGIAWEISGGGGAATAAVVTPTSGNSANFTAPFACQIGQFILAYAVSQGVYSSGPSSPWSDLNGASGQISWGGGLDIAWQIASSTSAPVSWGQGAAEPWAVIGVAISPPATAPSASGEAGFSYGPTIEVLTATVTPNWASTTVSFSYGLTNSYGNTSANVTVAAGGSPVTIAIPITGLTLGNTYHYQVVATNSQGTTNGTDATFTTVGLPSYTGG